MNRKFKKAMKPQKTFEEWARENDVELNDYAPISKRQYFSRWICQKKVIAGISTVMATCLILVAILVPVLLSNGSNPTIPPVPKVYTAQDSVPERIEDIEELYLINNMLLFDRSQIVEFNQIMMDVANDDETLVLSYTIQNCLIIANDEENAFHVDYTVRLYHYYEFLGYPKYANLTHSFLIGDIKIDYEIVEESREGNRANIRFVYNDLEYFLEVKGFEDVTDITEDTLKILLNDLFV